MEVNQDRETRNKKESNNVKEVKWKEKKEGHVNERKGKKRKKKVKEKGREKEMYKKKGKKKEM